LGADWWRDSHRWIARLDKTEKLELNWANLISYIELFDFCYISLVNFFPSGLVCEQNILPRPFNFRRSDFNFPPASLIVLSVSVSFHLQLAESVLASPSIGEKKELEILEETSGLNETPPRPL
jgi:hypothetical protein